MVLISSSSTFIHLASSASCMASLAQKFIQPLYLTWDPFLNIQLPPQPFHLNYGVTSQVLSWSLLSAQQWANPFQIYSYNNMALLETLQWLPTWAARIQFSQFSRSVMSDSATSWITARQASLSITNFWSLLKLLSIESVMPSNHLILCRPLLLLPSIFPSIRVFSLHQVAKVSELQLQPQSIQWIFRTDFL